MAHRRDDRGFAAALRRAQLGDPLMSGLLEQEALKGPEVTDKLEQDIRFHKQKRKDAERQKRRPPNPFRRARRR